MKIRKIPGVINKASVHLLSPLQLFKLLDEADVEHENSDIAMHCAIDQTIFDNMMCFKNMFPSLSLRSIATCHCRGSPWTSQERRPSSCSCSPPSCASPSSGSGPMSFLEICFIHYLKSGTDLVLDLHEVYCT